MASGFGGSLCWEGEGEERSNDCIQNQAGEIVPHLREELKRADILYLEEFRGKELSRSC